MPPSKVLAFESFTIRRNASSVLENTVYASYLHAQWFSEALYRSLMV